MPQFDIIKLIIESLIDLLKLLLFFLSVSPLNDPVPILIGISSLLLSWRGQG